jgi:DNA-binding IclR family transcriptional regulator
MEIVTGVGVLDKALHVVRAISAQPMNLRGLEASTGLPRATAHRLALALEKQGILRRDAEGRFDLGPELAVLGRSASARFPLAERALPSIEALRDETGESAQLFVREGSMRRCVLSLQSGHALRWVLAEGGLFPLELGSAGRVLMGDVGTFGWVESVEEREPGVASVSAPVIVDGELIGAVGVSGPIDRLTREPGGRYGVAVVAAAAAVAKRLQRH